MINSTISRATSENRGSPCPATVNQSPKNNSLPIAPTPPGPPAPALPRARPAPLKTPANTDSLPPPSPSSVSKNSRKSITCVPTSSPSISLSIPRNSSPSNASPSHSRRCSAPRASSPASSPPASAKRSIPTDSPSSSCPRNSLPISRSPAHKTATTHWAKASTGWRNPPRAGRCSCATRPRPSATIAARSRNFNGSKPYVTNYRTNRFAACNPVRINLLPPVCPRTQTAPPACRR